MSNEPSGLLIFGILLACILGLVGVMALVGTIADHRAEIGRAIGRAILGGRRGASAPPHTLRGARGHFSGSTPADRRAPARNDEENDGVRRSSSFSATGGERTAVPSVPQVTVSVPEAALIGARLGRGMAPSDVAKSLPGYSGKRYGEFVEKVRQVQAALAQIEAKGAESGASPATRAETV